MQKHLKKFSIITLAVASIGAAIGVVPVPFAGAATNNVQQIDSNVDCSTISSPMPYGVKVNNGVAGTYTLPGSGNATVSIAPNDGKYIDWTSTYPVDTVIVFGGASANVYRYTDSFGDTRLNSPQKKATLPPDISHVWFCHDGVATVTAGTAGVSIVDGARGTAVKDIPISALNRANDPDVYDALADNPLDAGTLLKSSGVLVKSSPMLVKSSGTLVRSSPLSAGTLLKSSPLLSASVLVRSSPIFSSSMLVRSAPMLVKSSGTLVRSSPFQVALSQVVPNVKDGAGVAVTWERVLAGTPYADWPLNSITFAQFISLLQAATDTTVPADGIIDYTGGLGLVANASIFDLDSTGAVIGQISSTAILLLNAPLLDLGRAMGVPASYWCDESKTYTGGVCLVADAAGNVYPDATLLELELYGVPSSIVPIGTITMGSLLPILRAENPKSPILGIIDGDQDMNGTIESAPKCQASVTLGQCVAELITPAGFPWEDLPLDKLNLQDFAYGQRIPLTVQFSVVGATTVSVVLPAGTWFDINAGAQACVLTTCTTVFPMLDSTGLRLTFSAGLPTGYVKLTIPVAPAGLITGAPGQPPTKTGPFSVSVTNGVKVSPTITVPGVDVRDPWAKNSTPAATTDTFYFGNLTANAIDSYDLTVPASQAGSFLGVRLTALDPSLDGDLTMFSQAPAPSTATAPTGGKALLGASVSPAPDPAGDSLASLAPETLQDVPTAVPNGFKYLKAVGANRGATDALDAEVDPASATPTTLRIQVSAYGTSTGRYAVRVQSMESGTSACPAVAKPAIGSMVLPTGVTAPRGVIVYNSAAGVTSSGLLGSNADNSSSATLYGFAKYTNSALLPVNVNPTLWTAATTATGFDCAPVAANATVQAIADVIKAQKSGTMPGLETIVLVGSDDRVPFYRVPDTTQLSNEAEFSEGIGTDNPISSSERGGYFLSDDPYGTLNPIPWLDRSFYVPDLAIGRLVESDAEIVAQLAAYRANDGLLTDSSAAVSGYDFLADGAQGVADTLAKPGRSVTTLIDPPKVAADQAWDVTALQNSLATNPRIALINGHFSQYQTLTSKGDATQTGDILDVDPTTTTPGLPAGKLAGSLLFSAGCHSGLSVPDAYAALAPLPGSSGGVSADWAQALSINTTAVWVANTGFGYGIPDGVALSERLMVLYTKYLLDPTSGNAADALRRAKQEYFFSQGVYGSYDEKVLQQVVFYGIPTFRFGNQTGVAAKSGGVIDTTAGTSTMPPSATISPASFDLRTVPGQNGAKTYSVAGDVIALNGYPVQPRTSIDVTPVDPTLVARGAIVEAMDTTVEANVTPVMARAVTDSSADEPAQQPDKVVFPTAMNSVSGNATQQRLVIYPGQFSDTGAGNQGEQMLVKKASYTVYYATPATAGDLTRPYIQQSTATFDAATNVVLFRVRAVDARNATDPSPATGVKRVVVLYDEGQATATTSQPWQRVELQPDSTGDFVGALVTPFTGGRYNVQVLDGAGWVSNSAFKGLYFRPNGGAQAPAAVAVVTQGTPGTNGWYKAPAAGGQDVFATLYVNGTQAAPGTYTYSIDGSAPKDYTGPIEITQQGQVIINFTPKDPNAPKPPELVVRRDTVAPTVTLSPAITVLIKGETMPAPTCTPADVTPSAATSSGVTVCNTSLPDTVAVVDGVPYTLANRNATDVAGNTSPTVSQTAVIVSGRRITDPDTGEVTYTADNGITVVAAGQQYRLAEFSTDGGQTFTTGVLGTSGAPTNTLVLTKAKTYSIIVRVPGGDGTTLTITVNATVADTLPPTITVPATTAPIEATSAAGAPADFSGQISAADGNDGSITPVCSVAGSSIVWPAQFAIGTTTVICNATDATGNATSDSFTVTVRDTVAPAVTVPAAITKEATAATTPVAFAVSATDFGQPISIVCTDQNGTPVVNGSLFAVGTFTITCVAKDTSNTTTKAFTISVTDTTAPSFGTVSNVGPVEGNVRGGATTSYITPTATDLVNGTVSVTCTGTPASGVYPVGVTPITCTASDAKGNKATATLTITVVDTTKPTVTVPANITAPGTSSAGAVVTFTVSANDIVSGPLTAICTPASGSNFGYTVTTVNCKATDTAGLVGTNSFTVTVVVAYRYNGFFSPVNMAVTSKPSTYDTAGLTYVVNTVNGGRNVPFKWEAYDNLSSTQLVSVGSVEIVVESYTAFYNRVDWKGQLGPNRALLPLPQYTLNGQLISPCQDPSRVVVPVSGSTTGKTTAVKFENNQFNIGVQMPGKPAKAIDNCFVAWTRITSPVKDPLPGIVSLFSMT